MWNIFLSECFVFPFFFLFSLILTALIPPFSNLAVVLDHQYFLQQFPFCSIRFSTFVLCQCSTCPYKAKMSNSIGLHPMITQETPGFNCEVEHWCLSVCTVCLQMHDCVHVCLHGCMIMWSRVCVYLDIFVQSVWEANKGSFLLKKKESPHRKKKGSCIELDYNQIYVDYIYTYYLCMYIFCVLHVSVGVCILMEQKLIY